MTLASCCVTFLFSCSSTGTLVIRLVETDDSPMEAGTPYTFSFTIKNGVSAQRSPVEIVVQDTIFTGIEDMVGDDRDPTGLGFDIYQPVVGDLQPLYIRPVAWEMKNIGQKSPYPCDQNTITATLKPSVKIYESCLQSLTFTGLTGSDTSDGNLTLSMVNDTVFRPYGEWTQNDGSLVVFLKPGDDHPMDAGSQYVFAFDLVNGFAAQHSPAEVLVAPNRSYDVISDYYMDEDMSLPDSTYGLHNPEAGDLRPMFIRNRTFETKNIGQATPYPCALNTITTTLAPTVPFYHTCLPELTIAGLIGGHPTQSPSGLVTLTVSDSNVLQTNATWDVTEGTLVVRLNDSPDDYTHPMEPGVEYTFSFEVFNDAAARESAAELVTASPLISVSQPMIQDDSVPNDSIVYNPQVGDLHPMYIRNVTWESRYIAQSNPYPCADNIITVRVAPSVPIYQRCIPGGFTITGLKGSLTQDDSTFDLTVTPTAAVSSSGIWNQSEGFLNVKLVDDASSTNPMDAGVDYTIVFTLKNPPTPQASITEIVVATPLVTFDQIMDSETGVIQNSGIFDPVNGDFEPMYVRNIVLEAQIYQTSPFPCDTNTISVSLSSNVDLSCDPRFTLSGLVQTATVNSTSLAVVFDNNGSMANVNGTWVQTNGVLDFSVLGGTGAGAATVNAGETFQFHFDIENPRAEQSSVEPNIKVRLAETGQSYSSADYALSYDTGYTPVFTGKTLPATLPAATDHAAPLLILGVDFISGTISQTISYPCHDNTITVSFIVDAFLVASCISPIRLSGLAPSNTGGTPIDVTGSGFVSSGAWNGAAGSLEVTAASDLVAGETYSFSFTLDNPASPQSGLTVTVSEANVIAGSGYLLQGTALQVDDVIFTTALIGQSQDPNLNVDNSYEPCGPNLVTVTLVSDTPLHSDCNGVQASIKLSGFASSSQSDGSISLVTNTQDSFASTLSFSQADGTAQLNIAKDLSSDTSYVFSFLITNGQTTSAGLSNIILELPHISNKQHSLTGTVLQVNNAVLTVSGNQATSQPCDSNVITISLEATFSIRTQCTPYLTLSGFTGTATEGTTATWAESSWPQFSIPLYNSSGDAFNDTAPWRRNTGTLIVELRKDLLKEDQPFEFTFTVQNGNFGQNARNVSVTSQSIYDPILLSGTVLEIDDLNFDVANIGQDTAYPCAENTITVTLATSVALLNTCVYVNDGTGSHSAADRYPAITISGLTGTRTGTSISNWSSSSTPFNNLTPTLTGGSLTFVPSGQVDKDDEHVFSFKVRNQAVQQGIRVMSVQADIFLNTAVSMSLPTNDLLKPMYIVDPQITGASASQTTDNPCSQNTITIVIVPDVPIYTFCNPELTLTGLTSTDGTIGQPVLSTTTENEHSIASNGGWSANDGRLITTFDSDRTTIANFTITFDISNPSHHQDAPGMKVEVAYKDSSDENLSPWTNLATSDGTNYLAASSTTNPEYPMKIKKAVVSTEIGQTSPFPCDSNIIRVTMSPSVILEPSCAPSITMTGLIGTATATTTIAVTFTADSTEWIKEATWDRSAGELIVDIMNSPASSISNSDVIFEFPVKNPNKAQPSPAIALTLRLDDTSHSADDHVSTIAKESGQVVFTDKSQCIQAASGNAEPLFIQDVDFNSGGSSQSSEYPCAQNTITVTMTTNGPLFDCVDSIVLTGLSGSTTSSATQFGLASQPNMISSTADWQNSGQLTLAKTDTLKGCNNITITFELTNPSIPQPGVDVTATYTASIASLNDVTKNITLSSAAVPFLTLYVVDTSWTSAVIASNSTQPCQPNTISVQLQPAIPLSCNSITIVISGIGNSRTADKSDIDLAGDTQFVGSTADWKQSVGQTGGQLTVTPTQALQQDTTYTFFFEIVNTDDAQSAVTDSQIQVVGQGSQPLHDMSGQIDATVAGVFNSFDVRADSQQPCGMTKIQICFRSFPAITKACVPNITVTGLSGSTTPTSSSGLTLSYEDYGYTGSNNFLTPQNWNKDTGKLVVALVNDLSPETEYCFAFELQNQRGEKVGETIRLEPSGDLMPDQDLTQDDTSPYVPPMSVAPLVFNTKTVTQSSSHPCAPNTIEFCLQPSVNIIKECINEINGTAYDRHPNIFIEGLTGTKTSGPTISLTQAQASGSKFVDSAQWDSSGTLTLDPLETDQILSTELVCFSIDVRNRAWGQNAPSISISADIMTHNEVAMDSGSGTTATLFVETPVFSAEVVQSTQYPCHDNTISLTLTSSVPMYGFCTQLITVEGLCGSTTSSQSLAVVASGGSNTNVNGTWQADGILTLDLQDVIDVDNSTTDVGLVFNLKNAECPQDGCEATALAVKGSTGLATDGDQQPWDASVTPGTGDNKPMFIQQAQLDVVLVQGGSHACVESELKMTFRSNVPLKTECISNLTIYGLTWFVEPTDFEMTPVALTQSNNNPFASANSAMWVQEESTNGPGLTLKIGEGVQAGVDYTIKMSASDMVTKDTIGTVAVGVALPSSVLCVDTVVSANISFDVNSAEKSKLRIFNVTQSSCTPCESNEIAVKFTVDEVIVGSCLYEITITGLQGFEALAGESADRYPIIFSSSEASNDLFQNYSTWVESTGDLIMAVRASNQQQQLSPNVEYTIRTTFRNPSSPRAYSIVGIAQHSEAVELYDVENDYQGTNACTDVLHIKPLTYEVTTCMNQTTAWAADKNTVSLSVKFDIKIMQSCSPLIRLGPLTGVCVPDLNSISMSSGSVFAGTFGKEDEYANFTILQDLNAGTYDLAFDVINPLDVQEARSGIVMAMQLRADSSTLPTEVSVLGCSSNLFNPQCPSFMERNVRQSSKYPGNAQPMQSIFLEAISCTCKVSLVFIVH